MVICEMNACLLCSTVKLNCMLLLSRVTSDVVDTCSVGLGYGVVVLVICLD